MQNTRVNVTPDATTDRAPSEKMNSNGVQKIIDTFSEYTATRVELPTDNVTFFTRLQIRDAQGNYVMATESQILEEAVRAIDHRYPTGTFSPQRRLQKNFSLQNLPAGNVKFLRLLF